ncbi:hypothetical protein ACIQUX_32455 [Streptomyces sp. NPDC101133]|uniref:hypothetical protein n=1 Tax=Streptomyces sp. NPDC101133 TaxID=3366111 RepID=UPI00382DB2A8
MLLVLSSLAALIWGSQQAVAADSPTINDTGKLFTSKDASGFVLYPREMPGVDEGQTARSVIEGAEAKGVVTRVSALSVAQSKQHIGRDLCHTTGINGTFKYNGFCWDETDDNTSAWSNGWHPQGFTASHDADPSGTIDGHHLYMASWYYGVSGDDRNKKARVSSSNRPARNGPTDTYCSSGQPAAGPIPSSPRSTTFTPMGWSGTGTGYLWPTAGSCRYTTSTTCGR